MSVVHNPVVTYNQTGKSSWVRAKHHEQPQQFARVARLGIVNIHKYTLPPES